MLLVVESCCQNLKSAVCQDRLGKNIGKTPLFEPFIYKNEHVTETGSGQTQKRTDTLTKDGAVLGFVLAYRVALWPLAVTCAACVIQLMGVFARCGLGVRLTVCQPEEENTTHTHVLRCAASCPSSVLWSAALPCPALHRSSAMLLL